MKENSEELMKRCPVCMNLFPASTMYMQDGFMACALCGAKYGTDLAKQVKQEKPPAGRQRKHKRVM